MHQQIVSRIEQTLSEGCFLRNLRQAAKRNKHEYTFQYLSAATEQTSFWFITSVSNAISSNDFKTLSNLLCKQISRRQDGASTEALFNVEALKTLSQESLTELFWEAIKAGHESVVQYVQLKKQNATQLLTQKHAQIIHINETTTYEHHFTAQELALYFNNKQLADRFYEQEMGLIEYQKKYKIKEESLENTPTQLTEKNLMWHNARFFSADDRHPQTAPTSNNGDDNSCAKIQPLTSGIPDTNNDDAQSVTTQPVNPSY